jgi:hypothetical protein
MTQTEKQLIEKLEEMIAFYKLSDRTPEEDIIYYEKLFAEIEQEPEGVTAEEILNKWCQFETHIDDGDFLYQNQRIRVLRAMEEYINLRKRFKMPTDKELVEIALLFNDGKIQKSKLRDMIAMTEFILDRLYENGNVTTKSSKE